MTLKLHPADFIAQYNRLGVRFERRGDEVIAQGAGVAPVFAAWVAEHSAALLPWLHTQPAQIVSRETKSMPPPVLAQPTPTDRLIHTGIQNARRLAQRKEAIADSRPRRKAVEGR